MHRTNLYLTPEQERALDARAAIDGVSRSALVRRIIDEAIGPGARPDPRQEDVFGRLAGAYHDAAQGMFDDDPDLRVDR